MSRFYPFPLFQSRLSGLLSLCAVFSLSGQDEPRSATEAVGNLRVFPGLEATLFASEPLIASPTNIDVDDRGRVWVCEVQNYREHGARDQRPAGDRILIMEDTDGDGVADLTKVFYQGRDVDAALGICVFDGRVIVTCAPNVIQFTDDDGDDIPDSKTYLFTETGTPQNDHSTHSFVFGPDGHFYWNMGNAGLSVHDRDGRQVYDQLGSPVFDQRASQWMDEYRNVKGPFWGGMVFRNNYEVTVDSYGNPWQSDNDDDGNYGVRLNYIMEHGNYGYLDELTGEGWRMPRVSAHADVSSRHWHQNDPGVVPNFVQTGAGSPTGITVYEGDLLPEQFRGKVLHCDAGPGVLWAADGGAEGAGFAAEMVHLVESPTDKWFRPVDVAVAPDGSLFLSDWYDPVVGWNRQTDLGKGRIYRIAPKDHRYRVPDFDFKTAVGATEALKSPTYSVRARAWQVLHGMEKKAVTALTRLAEDGESRYRARAYWLLAALPKDGTGYVQRALQDSDPNIRLIGLRSAARFGHPLIPVLEVLIDDPSPSVRRECAVTLRRLPDDLVPVLWARLAAQFDGEDRWYLEALGIGAEGRWDECLNAFLKPGAVSPYSDLAVRRILWRSRSVATPRHLGRMLSSPDVAAEEVPSLLRAFDFQPESDEKTRQLLELFESETLAGGPSSRDTIRYEVLTRVAETSFGNEPAFQESVSELGASLSTPSLKVALIKRFKLREMKDDLMELAFSLDKESIRQDAVRALFELGIADGILEKIEHTEALAERLVSLVAKSRHRDAVPGLMSVLKNEQHSQLVRETALRGLIEGGQGARAVLDLARSGQFPPDLTSVAGSSFSKTLHVIHRKAAAEFFPVPTLRGDEALPGMTEMLVYIGDPARGRQVFNESTCIQCHQIDGEGTAYGPALSGIGAKLAKQGLYESILDPSASVSPNYRGVELTLDAGEIFTGLIVSESDEALVINLQGQGLKSFLRSHLSEIRYLQQSVMPSGLQQLMSFNDLVDLVEFLATRRD